MKDILFPIRLDQWRNPVSTLLREVASGAPSHTFWSFSGPETEEDRLLGETFWQRRNVKRLRQTEALMHRFDILHRASATPRNATGATVSRGRSTFRRPVRVFTAGTEAGAAGTYEYWFRRAVKRAHILVAVSEAVAESIATQYGRRVDATVPNGVNPEFFSPTASRRLAPELERLRPYALYVGFMGRTKRPDVVVNVAENAPHRNFIMVGDAAPGDSFLASLPPNVVYLGRVERALVRDLLAHAGLLLFPSEREGLPLSVIEALAMGVPVIAQPVSSLPELICNGRNGWLINARDLAAWTDKTSEVMDWSDSARSAYAGLVRQAAIAKYAWREIAQRYAAIYEQCD